MGKTIIYALFIILSSSLLQAQSSILLDEKAQHEAVKEAVRDFLGNPENLEVDLVSPENRKPGHFKEMSIRMRDTTVKTLRLRYAWIKLSDCAISLKELSQKKKLRFITQGKADLVGYIHEDDLNALFKLHSKALRVQGPKFDFLPSRLRFSGRVLTRLFSSFLTVEGKLSVKKKTQVHFHPQRMRTKWFSVPQYVVRKLASAINPIADFSAFKFDVAVDFLETTDEHLFMATDAMREELEKIQEELDKKND